MGVAVRASLSDDAANASPRTSDILRRIHEAQAYDTTHWPPSHWRASLPAPRPLAPLRDTVEVDFAVIGAGFAGLSAALTLSKRMSASVAVLDAGQPGWGASGRNGGFCCLGGAKLSDAAIVARVGTRGAQDFRDFQHRAIECVEELLETEGIAARQGPNGDICIAHSRAAFAALIKEAVERQSLYGEDTDLIYPEEMAERGLSGAGFTGAAISPTGFPLHPLAYVEGLSRLVSNAGARIFADSPVTSLEPHNGRWRLLTPQGEVSARRVLIATNGYSSEDVPPWLAGRTLPAMSSILVTRPITRAEKNAQGFTTPVMSYDSRRLLHYFRHLPDGRFLFGMRGGVTATDLEARRTSKRLRNHFERLFPEWAAVETETEWSGMVCLTGGLAPFVGPVPGAEGMFAAFGWHGNGVAAASLGGRLAAELMTGAPVSIPALMRQPPKRFPLAGFRRVWLRAAYAAYSLKDGALP